MQIRGTLIVLAIGTALPLSASANPITLTQDRRDLALLAEVSNAGTFDRSTLPADTLTPADSLQATRTAQAGPSSGSASASLVSSISNLARMTGTGNAGISFSTSDTASLSALSQFSVHFTLADAFNYSFGGTFSGSGSQVGSVDQPDFETQGQWIVELFSIGAAPPLIDILQHTPGTLNRNGALGPGSYGLVVLAAATGDALRPGSGSGRAAFDFTFDLDPAEGSPSPTPEPASMLLLGSGAVGLFARRRRAQAR